MAGGVTGRLGCSFTAGMYGDILSGGVRGRVVGLMLLICGLLPANIVAAARAAASTGVKPPARPLIDGT